MATPAPPVHLSRIAAAIRILTKKEVEVVHDQHDDWLIGLAGINTQGVYRYVLKCPQAVPAELSRFDTSWPGNSAPVSSERIDPYLETGEFSAVEDPAGFGAAIAVLIVENF